MKDDIMALFESTLTLVLVAILLLQFSRSLAVPYPTLLALAGVIVAVLPWAPEIAIDPHLALALFIAPALLNAAYDFPPRAIKRYWLSLLSLAGVAVLLTAGAVAFAGMVLAGLPPAAAIALGAIVAPPDAAASAAILSRFDLPRRTVRILEGESLLNDAVALLLFIGAVRWAAAESLTAIVPGLALAVPGGVIFGILVGRARVPLYARMLGTQRATLFEFVLTFGVWIVADRLHLSPILAVVAFAMTVAWYMPSRQTPGDRVQSYAVWNTTGFLLNVLAFLLMGLQARAIVERLSPQEIWSALGFALVILAIVVVVRIGWVLLYNYLYDTLVPKREAPPTLAAKLVVSWCGMRGLVTLATALGLPADFPARDLIVLTALTVVLGTLILQGFTLGPLIRFLQLKPDHSLERELAATRLTMIDAAIESLGRRQDEAASKLREHYRQERAIVQRGLHPREVAVLDHLRRRVLIAKRRKLLELRHSGAIDEDVFHVLEQELDWDELAASPPGRFELHEG